MTVTGKAAALGDGLAEGAADGDALGAVLGAVGPTVADSLLYLSEAKLAQGNKGAAERIARQALVVAGGALQTGQRIGAAIGTAALPGVFCSLLAANGRNFPQAAAITEILA